MRKMLFFVLTFTVSCFIAACGGSGGGSGNPNTVPSYNVIISPTPNGIQYGASGTLNAYVRDDKGNPVANAPIVWSISDPSFGTFSSTTSATTVFTANPAPGGTSSLIKDGGAFGGLTPPPSQYSISAVSPNLNGAGASFNFIGGDVIIGSNVPVGADVWTPGGANN